MFTKRTREKSSVKTFLAVSISLAALVLMGAGAGKLNAQTTAFNYQGQLNNGGVLANGTFDLQFTLFDAGSAGNQVGASVTNANTGVTNGLFAAEIDFGASAFSGPPRWLQLGVRTNGSASPYTILEPLQLITAAPYAITALSASNLTGSVTASQVTGLPVGILTNSQSGVTLSGTFNGNGTGLTNLAATNLTGAVPAADLSAGLLTNDQAGVTRSGTFDGNGAGLTNLAATNLTGVVPAADLPAGLLTNNQAGVTLSGSFSGAISGNGSGLTGLNASQLGAIGLGQLPVGGPGGLVVNGASFVSLNGSFGGSFAGNGSSLNSINAGALTGAIPNSAIAGTYGSQVTFNNPLNVFAGDGSGLTGLPTLAPGSLLTSPLLVGPTTNESDFWITNGMLAVTNSSSGGVIVSNGNITFSGTLTGNGAGLTNANGFPYITIPAALVLDKATLLAASNLDVSMGATITKYVGEFQWASQILSNFVTAGGALPAGSLLTNELLVGPTTNESDFWITNGMLTVTNIGAGGAIISNGNITFSGNLIGNGSLLTGVQSSGPIMLSQLPPAVLTNDASGVTLSNLSVSAASSIAPLSVPATVPSSPLATAATSGDSFAVAVAGSFAYVVNAGPDGSTLQVINVADPSKPVTLGEAPTDPLSSSVAVAGRYAYVVNQGPSQANGPSPGSFQVIDVSNPSAPTPVSTISTGANSYPNSVAVSGRYAYVADVFGFDLAIVDVSNPVAPVTVGSASNDLKRAVKARHIGIAPGYCHPIRG